MHAFYSSAALQFRSEDTLEYETTKDRSIRLCVSIYNDDNDDDISIDNDDDDNKNENEINRLLRFVSTSATKKLFQSMNNFKFFLILRCYLILYRFVSYSVGTAFISVHLKSYGYNNCVMSIDGRLLSLFHPSIHPSIHPPLILIMLQLTTTST